MRVNNEWSDRGLLMAGAVALFALVGGFGVWAMATKISGAVVALGRIEVEASQQVVQHRDGGIVSEILVREGDLVSAGQVLVRLDAEDLGSELAITESQLFEVRARVARLEAERDGAEEIAFDSELRTLAAHRPEVAEGIEGQRRQFKASRAAMAREVEQLEKRRAQIADQIIGIQAQLRSRETQMALIEEELTAQRKLQDQGLTKASTVLALRRTQAEHEGTHGELIAAEAQARGRITETEIEILKLTERRREKAISELRDMSHQQVTLAENRRNLQDRMARLAIRAPVSGVVHGLQVHTPRSVLGAGAALLHLVPQDRPLVIVAQVATTDVDQVFPGQQVTLRLSALDSRDVPELTGHVAQVSADAFENERTGETFFRVELALAAGQLARLPEGVVLLPGMPVESFIQTGEQTPMAYLVKPFADYFAKALRES